VYQVDKTLADAGSKVSAAEQDEVRSALQGVREALAQNDTAAVGPATDRLERAAHKLAEAIYRAQGTGTGAAAPPEGAPASEVIDAEVVDSDTGRN